MRRSDKENDDNSSDDSSLVEDETVDVVTTSPLKRVTLKKSAFRSKRTQLSSEQAPTSMQSSVSGVQKHRNSGGSGDTVHEDIVATNSSRRLSFTAVRSPSNVANVSTTGNLVKVFMQFFLCHIMFW